MINSALNGIPYSPVSADLKFACMAAHPVNRGAFTQLPFNKNALKFSLGAHISDSRVTHANATYCTQVFNGNKM